MDTYIVYNCQGYEKYDEQKDAYMSTIDINVIATTEEEALKKAKEHHPSKPLFRCIGSTEYAKKHDNS